MHKKSSRSSGGPANEFLQKQKEEDSLKLNTILMTCIMYRDTEDTEKRYYIKRHGRDKENTLEKLERDTEEILNTE